ncbi:MAG: hypothetical protein ACP5N2_07320 [Candidatus Nanoarchaeia archaeon]
MEIKGIIIITVLVLLVIYILIKIFKILLSRSEFVSEKIKNKADSKYELLLIRFKQNYSRQPTHHELFGLVVEVSHAIIKMPGKTGHSRRQRVRKYLLEKNKIVKNYRMR